MSTRAQRSVLSRRVEELRSEVELLRGAQDRLHNVMRLQGVLRYHGLEVLGQEGPVRYELGPIVQCDLCEDLVNVEDLGFELRLRSRAWGPRHWYLHKEGTSSGPLECSLHKRPSIP
ncbi:MAG: hypothetical protein SA339_06130 [Methanomassiliicoccus sp.]|nr:hypothetical protein [Methanomassiliicoccus sp.]